MVSHKMSLKLEREEKKKEENIWQLYDCAARHCQTEKVECDLKLEKVVVFDLQI